MSMSRLWLTTSIVFQGIQQETMYAVKENGEKEPRPSVVTYDGEWKVVISGTYALNCAFPPFQHAHACGSFFGLV